ncbi:MAG: DUF2953 domain-containing protein [Clostridia bacterium]|nr:DUF2953 domain-containing protein [Clostridia bacterium]
MLYSVIFILLFLIVMILIGLSRLDLIYEYNLDGGKDHVVITVSAFRGILKYRKDISKDNKEKEKKTELRDKYIHFKQLYKLFDLTKKYLQKKIMIKDLKIEVEIGTGDACYTGITVGLVWSAVGTAVTIISNVFDTKKIYCNVTPNFSKKSLKLDLDCIFSMRIVNIIVVGLKMLVFYLKNRKTFKRTIGGDLSG